MGFSFPLDMLVAMREPTPCYHDAYSVGIPKGAYGGRAGKISIRPQFPPFSIVFFWLVNGLFTFLGSGGMDASYWTGSASWAW